MRYRSIYPQIVAATGHRHEARESRLWLRVILEEHLAPAAEVLPLLDEANQLVAIFTASNKRLKLGAIVRAPFVGVLILFAGPISAF